METEELLVTDWGAIPYPEDMKRLCPLRKDGWPDRRYSGAKAWYVKFVGVTRAMQIAYGSH